MSYPYVPIMVLRYEQMRCTEVHATLVLALDQHTQIQVACFDPVHIYRTMEFVYDGLLLEVCMS